MYDKIYSIEYARPKQYVRIQPFSSDYDYPDYDADYEDEAWLDTERKNKLPDDFSDNLVLYFEMVMDRLEKAAGYSTNLISLDEAEYLLIKQNTDENEMNRLVNEKYTKEREQFMLSVYHYWKEKRARLKHPLTPIVLTDKSGVQMAPNNPYLVFRRRTEKMQTRKNRKNEEQSYEKMLIIENNTFDDPSNKSFNNKRKRNKLLVDLNSEHNINNKKLSDAQYKLYQQQQQQLHKQGFNNSMTKNQSTKMKGSLLNDSSSSSPNMKKRRLNKESLSPSSSLNDTDNENYPNNEHHKYPHHHHHHYHPKSSAIYLNENNNSTNNSSGTKGANQSNGMSASSRILRRAVAFK
jgi:enhancer of polycomb-like protein